MNQSLLASYNKQEGGGEILDTINFRGRERGKSEREERCSIKLMKQEPLIITLKTSVISTNLPFSGLKENNQLPLDLEKWEENA